ncbi:zona pellucida sperm-binding protein 3 isoform X2 [Syngnathoides biaculeatus]|uniref:zona pellucida sperm-binding protein 3 isoform X2 n=1 Tax=Syngnathoides biaculeatus TaxID=300417 RepID=UPI002ADDE168|nr:zona pellucida sperm-binding protein 3 isoform X2 [Syngnathoides biaculeatus]
MGLMHMWIFLFLFYLAYSKPLASVQEYEDAELERGSLQAQLENDTEDVPPGLAPISTMFNDRFQRSISSARPRAPWYRVVPFSKDPKELFKPEKGVRPVPDSVKEMLLAPPPTLASPGGAAKSKRVEVLCHVDRMYVKVSKELFSTRNAFKDLKLGKCPVNEGTAEHYYLLYLLKSDCGFQRESTEDYLFISIVLHYKPTTPVIRELPFDVALRCKYPRHFHSFNPGISIELKRGTVYKPLRSKNAYTITPQDASGHEIFGDKMFILGQPMYFEVKQVERIATEQRLYINKCFMTAFQDPYSEPKYTIIDNQGCMIDSMVTKQSAFLKGPLNSQKFSVSAFIFKDTAVSSSSPLYLHCEFSMDDPTPTSSTKACNYHRATKKNVCGSGGRSCMVMTGFVPAVNLPACQFQKLLGTWSQVRLGRSDLERRMETRSLSCSQDLLTGAPSVWRTRLTTVTFLATGCDL